MVTPEIPIVRLQLRYPDENTFIQRFSANVTRGGIFIASRSPFAVGTVIAFEISLLAGPPMLGGSGKVAWVREFDPEEPQRAHGMGVQFIKIAPGSRPMLDRLLAHKTSLARRTPMGGVPATAPSQAAEASAQAPATVAAGSGPHETFILDGDPSTWIDDQGLRAAADRARVIAGRVEDVESLRIRDREDAPSIEQALAELPRLLTPRRQAG